MLKPSVRSRLTPLAVACLLLAGGGRALTASGPLPHDGCPEGHPKTGDLGIGTLQCAGGTCMVNSWQHGEYVHRFSTEPRVWHLDPAGPAAAALREGDSILAIDGEPITTAEGGRRLANLRPGVAVHLRIRRDHQERMVALLPAVGCNMPNLAVTTGPTTRSPRSPGE